MITKDKKESIKGYGMFDCKCLICRKQYRTNNPLSRGCCYEHDQATRIRQQNIKAEAKS